MPITITVDIDSAGVMASLEVMPALVAAEAERAMVISTHIVEAEVKALTPRKTGRLFSAWESKVHGYTGIVSNNVSYAGFVEGGTDPHIIRAKGGALMIPVSRYAGVLMMGSPFGGATLSGRLRAGQQFILRKSVRHPGFLGRYMAHIGASIAKPLVVQVFRDAVKDAVRLAFGK